MPKNTSLLENFFSWFNRRPERCSTYRSGFAFFTFTLMFMPIASNADQFSAAFYYGINPPLPELRSFNVVVVEPSNLVLTPDLLNNKKVIKSEMFAYVSIGEVNITRPYFKKIPTSVILGENSAWNSVVLDQASPVWRNFFLSHVLAPLRRQGWRNFFIDTLDSYQLFAETEESRKAQREGLIMTLKEIKRQYPETRLIFNRGFELLPELAPFVHAVAAESLYRRFDASNKTYVPVPEEDRLWLIGKLKTVRDELHVPVISIDYVDPGSIEVCAMVRDTAKRIRADGFTPWITNNKVDSLMQIRCEQ